MKTPLWSSDLGCSRQSSPPSYPYPKYSMSLSSFLFMQSVHSQHNELRRKQRRASRRQKRNCGKMVSRMKELEDDVGYLALVLGTLLQQMDAKGVITRADVQAAMKELDLLDGEEDGTLDIDVLRAARD
jgi:hypothetical protein